MLLWNFAQIGTRPKWAKFILLLYALYARFTATLPICSVPAQVGIYACIPVRLAVVLWCSLGSLDIACSLAKEIRLSYIDSQTHIVSLRSNLPRLFSCRPYRLLLYVNNVGLSLYAQYVGQSLYVSFGYLRCITYLRSRATHRQYKRVPRVFAGRVDKFLALCIFCPDG